MVFLFCFDNGCPAANLKLPAGCRKKKRRTFRTMTDRDKKKEDLNNPFNLSNSFNPASPLCPLNPMYPLNPMKSLNPFDSINPLKKFSPFG